MVETLEGNWLLENIIHYLQLTLVPEVLWSVIPLAIATLLLIIYFQRYRTEKMGWNSYLSNSLVLLFVSLSLFRYIYNISGLGASNFITYSAKSIAAVFVLLIGFILIRFNFEHLLPERFADYVSNPLTVNLAAYAVVLFVYSSRPFSGKAFIALLFIVVVLSIMLHIIKIPLHWLFEYIKKEKEKEKVKSVKEIRYQIDELARQSDYWKKELKRIEKEEFKRNNSTYKKVKNLLKVK